MRRLGLRLAAVLALAAAPVPVSAQEAPVHAVVLVDVIPPDMAAGLALLTDYVRRARRDPDLSSVTLIQQFGIPNHFMLEEVFAGEAARRRFLQKPYVRDFRSALFPHLGSPWDERLGAVVSP